MMNNHGETVASNHGETVASKTATGHRAPWSSSTQALVELVEGVPRVLTPQRSPYWEGVGPVVLRACGGCHASI